MRFKLAISRSAVLIVLAASLLPGILHGEELPDDIRFFDSNEELDNLDGEVDTSSDAIIELYLDVGSYFYNVGKFGDAIATYASVLSRDRECAEAWYGLARCYAQTSEFDKTITALEKAIFLQPEYKDKARSEAAFEELKGLPRFEGVLG